MIIVAVDDLMFASRISSAAKALGVDIAFARSPEAIVEAVRTKAPRLVILDLNSVKVRPLEAVAAVEHVFENRHVRKEREVLEDGVYRACLRRYAGERSAVEQDVAGVGRVEAGGTFGEIAIIDSGPRTLTSVAGPACEIAVINQHDFLFLVHETPTFAIDVMRSMAHLIRELES